MSPRALLAVLVLLLGCGTDSARVEDLASESAPATGFELQSATGDRDGDRTEARFEFSDGTRTLVVELTLSYDPQPVLAGGRWSLGADGGSIRAESVRFVGGQGEGPSVGGVYVLGDEDGDRFRVHLPLTRVAEPWSASR
jgi:hypothetical protein